MIYVIVGPTGVGKTKLSVALAKKLNAEIINADSMQVYQGLDIGTAKIREEEKEGIPHHLFDIVDVSKTYTVYDYQKDAREKIEEIISRGKNVIMVGGTGLYIRACLYDYQFQEETTQESFEEMSNEELLKQIYTYTDQVSVHPNNRKRLIRLLNRYKNGETEIEKKSEPLYDFYMIGLTTDRKALYEKIDSRVDQMIEDGLLEEVEALYKQNIYSKAIQTGIGYKELYRYFEGNCTKEEAISEIKKNSRHYAKRQYTFFNHQFSVHWFETDYVNFQRTIDEVLESINRECD
ncbi:MAG: tRNA (adenosine(37)-N6)-dimethylallyltransferase MiaA [Bacilli bacterium]|nr:tRNA (adenosine(37)-N6)-dimethylallyltransferase MiaA [Bacilli bacterium]